MEKLGKYLIKKQLIDTPYSTLYLGHDPDLDVAVALKHFNFKPRKNDSTYGEEFWRKRFIFEARLMAKFDHPHIVGIRELCLSTDNPFIVMPFIEANLIYEIGQDVSDGTDIRHYQGHDIPKALSLPRALEILRQTLSALSAFHALNMVHRDLKPGNILLTKRTNGRVKLCDFGMIKTPDWNESRSGVWIGTLNYMSPEQRHSATDVDARADIYAFGVLAYRLLCGVLPSGAFAPPKERCDLPPQLSDLILQCLAPDRKDRPKDAGVVLKLLSQIPPGATKTKRTAVRYKANVVSRHA